MTDLSVGVRLLSAHGSCSADTSSQWRCAQLATATRKSAVLRPLFGK